MCRQKCFQATFDLWLVKVKCFRHIYDNQLGSKV